jgi:hypothetical protein
VVSRRRPRARVVVIAVLALAALAGCSASDPPPPIHSPSPFFGSGPSGASSGTGAVSGATTASGGGGPSGGYVQTGPTGSGDGPHGALAVRVTGDIQVTRRLTQIVSASYAPPGGAVAIVWTAGGTDPSTASLGGLSFVGARATAPTLALTLTVPSSSAGFETFVSIDGECRVTITRATASAIAGSFRCSALTSATGVAVDATATFTAAG